MGVALVSEQLAGDVGGPLPRTCSQQGRSAPGRDHSCPPREEVRKPAGEGRARTSRAPLTARLTAPLLLVAAVMAGGSWIFVARAAAPSDGTVVALSDRLPRSNLVISAVLDPASALRSGDVVVAIDGFPVDRLASVSPPQIGEVHRYTVWRDGAVLQVPV